MHMHVSSCALVQRCARRARHASECAFIARALRISEAIESDSEIGERASGEGGGEHKGNEGPSDRRYRPLPPLPIRTRVDIRIRHTQPPVPIGHRDR